MGLAEYNRKRNFQKTTEPPGREGATASGNSFVIQKHAASRLHYDFRLELDGVLKSWSVPKGPSCDPLVKRLAVAVEDHPIDYGGFEGVIPAGEYGGGTVLLWDRGTWQPLSDPQKALAEGQLKFELTGEKLQGRWVLVKIKDRGGRGGQLGPPDRSWLLIKERDANARPEAEWNVTDASPNSVATGREMAEIASASDRVWHSNRDRPAPARVRGARTAAMPDRVVPARATPASSVPTAPGWIHEIQIRGQRLICRIDAGTATLLDDQGADRTAALPALARAARSLPLHDAIIDGMATALGTHGETSAEGAPDTFYVFDLMRLDGSDLSRTPLSERKALLQSVVKTTGTLPALRYVDHIVGRGAETFQAAKQLGAPGVVSKRAASAYPAGPAATRDWRVVACGAPDDNPAGGRVARTRTPRAAAATKARKPRSG